MRTVTAMDLRRKLGEILDAASVGERILIERDHRPLAVLVSVEDAGRLEDSREERSKRMLAALDRLDEFQARMAKRHPWQPGMPAAAELIRMDRDRDDPERGQRRRPGPGEAE